MQITKFCWDQLDEIFSILSTENNGDWTYEQLKQSLELDSTLCFVAKENSSVLGFIIISQTQFDFDILELVVKLTERNKGVGSKLVSHIISYALSSKKEKATLEVAFDNECAISLYKKFGFKQIAKRVRYYNNGKDALIFQKCFD